MKIHIVNTINPFNSVQSVTYHLNVK